MMDHDHTALSIDNLHLPIAKYHAYLHASIVGFFILVCSLRNSELSLDGLRDQHSLMHNRAFLLHMHMQINWESSKTGHG